MAYLPTWPVAPIKIKLLYPDAVVPKYMSEDAAGADVCAYLDLKVMVPDWWKAVKDYEHTGIISVAPHWDVPSNCTSIIPLGFALEIPRGFMGIIKGRSGLAAKGIECHHGTIDSDFRGGCSAILYGGRDGFRIKHGDRIGQLLIVPCYRPAGGFDVVDELSTSARGTSGYGSTGR